MFNRVFDMSLLLNINKSFNFYLSIKQKKTLNTMPDSVWLNQSIEQIQAYIILKIILQIYSTFTILMNSQ